MSPTDAVDGDRWTSRFSSGSGLGTTSSKVVSHKGNAKVLNYSRRSLTTGTVVDTGSHKWANVDACVWQASKSQHSLPSLSSVVLQRITGFCAGANQSGTRVRRVKYQEYVVQLPSNPGDKSRDDPPRIPGKPWLKVALKIISLTGSDVTGYSLTASPCSSACKIQCIQRLLGSQLPP